MKIFWLVIAAFAAFAWWAETAPDLDDPRALPLGSYPAKWIGLLSVSLTFAAIG
jgi:hypothetical protein